MDAETQSTDAETQSTAIEIQSTESKKIINATERNKCILIAKKNNLLNNKIFRTIKQNNYAIMKK